MLPKLALGLVAAAATLAAAAPAPGYSTTTVDYSHWSASCGKRCLVDNHLLRAECPSGAAKTWSELDLNRVLRFDNSTSFPVIVEKPNGSFSVQGKPCTGCSIQDKNFLHCNACDGGTRKFPATMDIDVHIGNVAGRLVFKNPDFGPVGARIMAKGEATC